MTVQTLWVYLNFDQCKLWVDKHKKDNGIGGLRGILNIQWWKLMVVKDEHLFLIIIVPPSTPDYSRIIAINDGFPAAKRVSRTSAMFQITSACFPGGGRDPNQSLFLR